MDTITIEHPADTQMDDLESIEVAGQQYVPLTGNLVTEQDAVRRRAAGGWPEAMCRAAYWVTYHRADSRLVRAMGR